MACHVAVGSNLGPGRLMQKSADVGFAGGGQPDGPLRDAALSEGAGGAGDAAGEYSQALLFAFAVCVGHHVCVQTQDGGEYEGIFHTPGLSKRDTHIVLKNARKLNRTGQPDGFGDVVERLVICSQDLVQIKATNVTNPVARARASTFDASRFWNFSGHTSATAGPPRRTAWMKHGDPDGFSGDRQRARGKAGLIGRELQPWVPEELNGPNASSGLYDTTGQLVDYDHGVGTWDQFEANERMFGVKTTFDFNLYTSTLDETKSKYSRADADAIAREIENSVSTNPHVAQERGHNIDDSGLDEENQFSCVGVQTEPKEDNHSPRDSNQACDERPPKDEGPSCARAARIKTGSLAITTTVSRCHNGVSKERLEVNRLKQEMICLKTTHHGSPLSHSPLIRDHAGFEALDLNPGLPKVDEQLRKKFMEWKQRRPLKPAIAAEKAGPLEQNTGRGVLGASAQVHHSPFQPRPQPSSSPLQQETSHASSFSPVPPPEHAVRSSPLPSQGTPRNEPLPGPVEWTMPEGRYAPVQPAPPPRPPASHQQSHGILRFPSGSSMQSLASTQSIGSQLAYLNPFAKPFHPGPSVSPVPVQVCASPADSFFVESQRTEGPLSEASFAASSSHRGDTSSQIKTPRSLDRQSHSNQRIPSFPALHPCPQDPPPPPSTPPGRRTPPVLPGTPSIPVPPPRAPPPPPPMRVGFYGPEPPRGPPPVVQYDPNMWQPVHMGPMNHPPAYMMGPPCYPPYAMPEQFQVQYYPAPMMPAPGMYQPCPPMPPMHVNGYAPPVPHWNRDNSRPRGGRGGYRKATAGRGPPPRRGPA